ncbi:hypothetical protein ACFVTT_10295 [Streptomyces niveus]|uniref:hypothetical protein n=1 Tax=Streptomyces niveus TaxID=193462 RepID=UPI00342336D4
MKFKRMSRFGTTGALVAAAFASSIVLTPATASADSDWKCYGKQVKRCVTVLWDQDADTYQGRAKITDVAGGGNYNVKVNNVKLQRFNGTKWVNVRTKADNDGWHATEDLAGTATVDPCLSKQAFRVVATFGWRGAGSGDKTWSPDWSWVHMC